MAWLSGPTIKWGVRVVIVLTTTATGVVIVRHVYSMYAMVSVIYTTYSIFKNRAKFWWAMNILSRIGLLRPQFCTKPDINDVAPSSLDRWQCKPPRRGPGWLPRWGLPAGQLQLYRVEMNSLVATIFSKLRGRSLARDDPGVMTPASWTTPLPSSFA